MTNFPPTDEQQLCLDAFATGESMVIEAGAGTGKTTTLRLLGESTDRRGLFIAFNKSVQLDAEASFPANVECRTGHSLAYKGMFKLGNGWFVKRLKSPRVNSRRKVEILGIPQVIQIGDEMEIRDWEIASLAMGTVKRFCYSADTEINETHVPYEPARKEVHSYLAKIVLPYAEEIWRDANDPKGKLQFTHDYYLKIWALAEPTLEFDFLMLDEAQDTNPVLAKVFNAQAGQKIVVGDRCQAIYEWRGARDALSIFPAQHRLLLSQSFRFGQAVAVQANKFLRLLNSPLNLKGHDKIESEVVGEMTDPSCIICRTNATVIQHAMEHQKAGRKVAIVGGTKDIESFTKAAQDLMNGTRGEYHPDLAGFGSWAQVEGYSKTDEGSDLRVMVKLIETYGCDAILQVCAASTDEKTADLIVTTAHKAKGREWNQVQIANDFKAPEEGEQPSDAELKLIYVAVTRAIKTLECNTFAWVDEAQAVAA